MSKITQPTILIIIGASGDLSKRKLLPAIAQIAKVGILPDAFKIVGVSRRTVNVEDILPKGSNGAFGQIFETVTIDLTQVDEFTKLKQRLEEIEAEFGHPAQRLFYLSVPPQAVEDIIDMLGQSGLNVVPNTKILLEKPFGVDRASAEHMIGEIKKYFTEEQVYRIDHYLAKEMTQNIIVFRSKNSLFKNTWNKDFIESIEIIASQTIDIEGRASFYEQTGALRDFVQSHLMQLTALTLMELPHMQKELDTEDWSLIPSERLKALAQIDAITHVSKDVVRAQYVGYRDEVGKKDSSIETFMRVQLTSSDVRWRGVPITVLTGKALDQKITEIRIYYKRETVEEANMLVMRIQPSEGVEVCLWVKKPGFERKIQQLKLDFTYSDHFTDLPEAYERVLVDAMRGDRSLFTTSEEVLESWRIMDPIQHAWKQSVDDLRFYEKGTSAENI
jgi:glucose-6-phosphate 1-dehydrogenase